MPGALPGARDSAVAAPDGRERRRWNRGLRGQAEPYAAILWQHTDIFHHLRELSFCPVPNVCCN